jgi:hypothetical protein
MWSHLTFVTSTLVPSLSVPFHDASIVSMHVCHSESVFWEHAQIVLAQEIGHRHVLVTRVRQFVTKTRARVPPEDGHLCRAVLWGKRAEDNGLRGGMVGVVEPAVLLCAD